MDRAENSAVLEMWWPGTELNDSGGIVISKLLIR